MDCVNLSLSLSPTPFLVSPVLSAVGKATAESRGESCEAKQVEGGTAADYFPPVSLWASGIKDN